MSHSLETNVNLAIRLKKIISNILVSIPVTHENNLHINCLCPFSPLPQWTQWHTVIIYRLLFAEVRQQPGCLFQISTNFLYFFLCQISCSNFWVDRMFQASARTLFHIRFKPNPLKFFLNFSFHILTFVPLYCCAVVQKLCNLQENEFLRFLKEITLWQPMARVYICFEMTDSKVILASSIRRKILILEGLL
jgi:hypothetical protein